MNRRSGRECFKSSERWSRGASAAQRLERGHVAGEPPRQLRDEAGVPEVRIGPCLREASPRLGLSEKGAGDGLATEAATPMTLVSHQPAQHRLVVSDALILAMKPDLDRDQLCVGRVFGRD